MSSIEIIPTNTCPPDLAEFTRRSEKFAEYAEEVQLDISDGKFTPVVSWPFAGAQWDELIAMSEGAIALPARDAIRYEVHMMIEQPRECGILLAKAGVSRIMAHLEAFDSIDAMLGAIDAWKSAGAQEAGVALLIDTPLERVSQVAHKLDCLLLMSIPRLGAQGAPFDERIFDRLRAARSNFPDLTLAVDGGVSDKNIAELVACGARRFGVGSAISKAADPASAYHLLKATGEGAL